MDILSVFQLQSFWLFLQYYFRYNQQDFQVQTFYQNVCLYVVLREGVFIEA